ncbi:MAG: nitrous oxide reductase accessory protein NosL, partial [Betaproteobacteria bacterium HGW-Betaproteobacteria-13]
MNPSRSPLIRLRGAVTVLLAAGLLAACGADKGSDSSILAVEIDRSTSCALDGML